MPMKISIITAVYNCADHIGDCIRSVAHQIVPPNMAVEHIVIDGGSTDGTQEVVLSFGDRVAVFVSERDQGVYFAMNKGLERATGDVIAFLNADDMYAHPHVLANIMEQFRASPSADAVYGDVVFVERDHPTNIFRFWKSVPMYPGYFRDGEVPHHLALFIRREALQKTGMIHTEFRVSADYDLIFRLFQVTKATGLYCNDLCTVQRLGGISNRSVKNILRGNVEILKAWHRHGFGVPIFTLFIRRPLHKIRQIIQSHTLPQRYAEYLATLYNW